MKRILRMFGTLIIIILLIADAKTASYAAAEGMKLCFNVLVPSLFPLFIITTYLNAQLVGRKIPGIHHLGRFLHIPSGGESILLLGLLGGYPVGAQLIADLYRQGKIDSKTGHILLGYCSNAGPAFIFGVTGILFGNPWVPVLLWIIHIASAVLTGLILPKPRQEAIKMQASTISFVQSIHKSIHVCVSVSAWVVIFKIIQAYLEKWILYDSHSQIRFILCGILELSNGCVGLLNIQDERMRFILCSGFLAFGGICVVAQTFSVTEPLGIGLYLPGKLTQTAICLVLSSLLCYTFIGLKTVLSIIIPCILLIIIINLLIKKAVEIQSRIMYNTVIEA